jgi:signal transduction histidine kinase/CheY-like chemotaxis protein
MRVGTFLNALWRKRFALFVVFVTYLVTAQLAGYLYRDVGTSPNIVLAPVGISLAAFILEGYVVWPAIMLAALINALLSSASPLFITASVLGNTLQPAFGLFMLRQLKFDRSFFSLKDMFGIVFTALLSTMIVPSFLVGAVLVSHIFYGTQSQTHWTSWWIGGILSALVITPFLIRWIRRSFTPRSSARYIEIGVVFSALTVCSYFLFATTYVSLWGISLIYVLIAMLFWLAFRGGVRFTTFGLFVMTAISLVGALYGHYAPQPGGLNARVFNTEVFDLLLVIFFFVIVSLEEQRTNAQRALMLHANKLQDALDKISVQDEAKNEFIALLGHELRNPLASLLSSVEVLTYAEVSSTEKEDILSSMNDRIRSMAHLLDDIFDMSRITQRKFTLRTEVVNVADVVKRAVLAVAPLMHKQRHAFSIDVPEEGLMLEADPTRLEQIIVNLLHNAAKYTPPGGSIALRVQLEEGAIVLSVADSGIGIVPEMMERIFEPFVQINPKSNRAGGLGVGLSLTKGLVELHGGRLAVTSEGEGRGSEFTVRLPALSEQTAQQYQRSQEQKSVVLKPSLDILVVDDNQEAAQGLARLLGLRGHDVHVAYEGEHVVEAAVSLKPDVIILDIGLPDIDGYEVARRLADAGVQATLIALTGYGQSEDKKKARAAGFQYHLTKPIGLAEIEPFLEHIASEKYSSAEMQIVQ